MSIQNLAQSASVYALPLRNRFRNVDVRHGALIEGPSGWSEFAPFDDYTDEISGRWLAAALEQSHGSWPNVIRNDIPVNGILPIVDLETTKSLTRDLVSRGISVVKLKVNDGTANSLEHDIARIAAVREVVGPEVKIRIDVNGSWTVDEAVHALNNITSATGDIDYVEQPARTLSELKELRIKLDGSVRIAVDESIRQAQTLHAADIRNVADVAIVKSIPLGGVAASLNLINEIGLPVVVSGSLDTSVGLASGLTLAGCVDNLYGACGLGTGLLFAHDVVAEPLLPMNGVIAVERRTPDAELLQKYTAPADVTQQWHERIIRSWNASAIHLVSDEVREAVMA